MEENHEICKYCKQPFRRLASAGKFECSYHPGRVEENRWTCCKKRYAYDTELSFTDTYQSRRGYARRTFPGFRETGDARQNYGCTPCDHVRQNVEFEEIRDGVREGFILPHEIQKRPGFCLVGGKPKLKWKK